MPPPLVPLVTLFTGAGPAPAPLARPAPAPLAIPMKLTELFRRHYTPAGAPPGSMKRPERLVAPRIHAIAYDAESLEELDVAGPEQALALVRPGRVVWIDVQGLGDGSVVHQLGMGLGLHPLALSDVVNLGQRPKFEDYDDVLFGVVRMIAVDEDTGALEWEQVSLFLGPGWVLTFQETHGDCLDPLRERLRKGRRQVREAGGDYLACMVVDTIVDAYFPVLEHHGDELERLETAILRSPTREILHGVYRIRRDLVAFRRAAWPLRDSLNQLLRDEDAPISDHARPYLRDTTDHIVQIVDVNETYRELASSLVDVYLSTLGHRTNEIMRVLTVVSTIFIPLTFLAGVYGMNFDTTHPLNLPELGWPYGYVAFWLVTLAVGCTLLVIFRRLGWLGGRASEDPDPPESPE